MRDKRDRPCSKRHISCALMATTCACSWNPRVSHLSFWVPEVARAPFAADMHPLIHTFASSALKQALQHTSTQQSKMHCVTKVQTRRKNSMA